MHWRGAHLDPGSALRAVRDDIKKNRNALVPSPESRVLTPLSYRSLPNAPMLNP